MMFTHFTGDICLNETARRILISSIIVLFVGGGCTHNEPYQPRESEGVLNIVLNPIQLGTLLPGGYFQITGQGLIEEASYLVYLDLNEVAMVRRIPLEVVEVNDGILVRWPVEEGLTTFEGEANGSVVVDASLRGFVGSARVEWSSILAHSLAPRLTSLSLVVSAQTPSTLIGDQLLATGEGTSILNLTGEYTDSNGGSLTLDMSEPLFMKSQRTIDEPAPATDRSTRWWMPRPSFFGIRGGRFEGSATITNNGPGGLLISDSVSVSFDLSEPFISFVSPQSVSRGQRLFIEGGGLLDLVDGADVGLTTISFNGQLVPFNPARSPVQYEDLRLELKHDNGARVSTSFEPQFNSSCESLDVGGVPGVLEGELIATVYWRDDEVVTPPTPVSVEIAPSKQVVYLSFLPAFTDSLRLFGLRNVSVYSITS